MLKSLRALLGQDPGYDLNHVLSFSVNLPDSSYPSDKTYPFNSTSALRFDRDFSAKLQQLPGVTAVTGASGIPAQGGSGSIRFVEEGRPVSAGHEDEANILTVTTSYFSTLRVPLISGRNFGVEETIDRPWVVVVNQTFAKNYFPNEDAVGNRIRFTYSPKEPYRQIVGIVGDTAEVDLTDAHPPIIYCPNNQGANTFINYLVRTSGDPSAIIAAVRSTLREMDPQLPLIQPQTLAEVAGQSPSVFLRRYPSYLIGSFAGLAVVLAMVGLYGLISYSIEQRTREIGIRVTLGAQRGDVLHMVLRQGMITTFIGVAVGIAGAIALTRLLNTLLFGVKPADWSTFVSVAALLLIAAIGACVIPARRAMTIDPMVALRHE
jgi:putative ABC transport system permease protein